MAIIVTLPGALVVFIAASIKVFLLDGTVLQGISTYFTMTIGFLFAIFVLSLAIRLLRPAPASSPA